MSSALMRQRFLGLNFTPSLQLQNLSTPSHEDFHAICYIHDADVICMELDDDFSEPHILRQFKVDMRGGCLVYQAGYLNLGGRLGCLGIATDNGFYLWSAGGDRMLWFADIEAILAANPKGASQPDLQFHYTRGMAAACPPDASSAGDAARGAHICFGSSVGGVCIYSFNGTLVRHLAPAEEGCAITCLDASAKHLVSADEEGNICAYSITDNYKNVMQVSTAGTDNSAVGKYCTCICTRGGTAAAAFNTGHLRVYNISFGQCILELTAHSRCITGMSLHPTEDFIATCGEDQAINVWTLPTFSPDTQSTMDLTHCEHWVDSMCTGVAWMHDSHLLCVGYDSNNMFIATHHKQRDTRPEEFRQMKEMSVLLHRTSTAMEELTDDK